MHYRPNAPKKPVNLSLNGDLLKLGKNLGLNLSSIAEAGLASAIRARLAEEWLAENETAIRSYNDRVAERGVFSDGLRGF